MEENYGRERQDEIVISFRKIWDNVIRYWRICAICFGLAVLAATGITVLSYVNEKNALEAAAKEETEEEKLEDEEETEYIYQAASMVYLAREQSDLTGLIKDIMTDASYLEERSDYVELYKEYLNVWIESTIIGLDKALLYDCLALVGSNTVITEINKQLLENGYKEYDVVLDKIDMQLSNNARFYKLTVSGDDPERAEFISNAATKILMDKSVEILDIKDSVLIDEAVVQKYIKELDETLTLVTERQKEAIREKAREDIEKLSIGFSSFLSLKSILVVFMGIFFGLGIIFIMILLDKRIRTRDELAYHFSYPIIGEVDEKNKDEEQYNILMTALEHKCSKEELRSVLVTSAGTGKKVTLLVEKLVEAYSRSGKKVTRIDGGTSEKDLEKKISEAKKKDGMTIVNATGMDRSAAALKSAGLADGIMMIVNTNNEGIPEIQKAFSNIKIVDGNVLGCVLMDCKK